MAQRIKIQDGKVVYQATDSSYDLEMGIQGYLGVTKELGVGSNPLIDGAIYTPSTASLRIAPGLDLRLEPSSGKIYLNNVLWPTTAPIAGQFIGSTGIGNLEYLPFLISFTGSDSLTQSQLNSSFPNASPGQFVAGPNVLYTCISSGQWRTSVASPSYTPVNKAGDTMEGFLILNADPTQALGAVTKQYVDALSTGLKLQDSVVAATTSPLPSATYNNGTAGVGATLTASTNGLLVSIGGYSLLSVGNRVLVKNQADAIENGIYVISDLGTDDPGGAPWVLVRSSTFDEPIAGEVESGAYTYVGNGTLAGTQWAFLANAPVVIGTDPLNFTQISGVSNLTSGAGISIISNAITNTGVLSLAAGSGISLSASSGNITVTSTSPAQLVDLTDVSITSPVVGDTLTYDGVSWVNNRQVPTRVINKISDYSLVMDDFYNTLIRVNNTAPVTITVPNDFTTAFPIGATVMVSRIGTGTVTIGYEAGVTIATPSSLSVSPQYGRITLIKTAANFWEIAGSLA